MKKTVLASALALATIAISQQAFAASAVSAWFSGEENKLSDNSAEYLFNRVVPATGPNAGSNTTIEVGDVLLTAFEIATVEDLTGTGGTNDFGSGGTNYLTGVAAIEATSVIVNIATNTALYTFAPLSAAAKADLAAGVGATLPSPVMAAEVASWSANTILALYDDPATNFLRVPTPAGGDDGDPTSIGADVGIGPFATEETMFGTAIDGTKILELGFNSADDFWVANSVVAATDVLALRNLPAGQNVGAVNFALDVLYQGGAAANWDFKLLTSFNPQTSAVSAQQFVGNGNIQGLLTGSPGSLAPANTPFDIFDDLNANFRPVPEPATIALLGLGMAGFGFAQRRRRREV